MLRIAGVGGWGLGLRDSGMPKFMAELRFEPGMC